MGSVDEACQAVSWLLRQGADPYIRCRWTNMAAIHYAAYFDVAPVVAILLAATKGIGTLLCYKFSVSFTAKIYLYSHVSKWPRFLHMATSEM